jgi:hypothetical protein
MIYSNPNPYHCTVFEVKLLFEISKFTDYSDKHKISMLFTFLFENDGNSRILL